MTLKTRKPTGAVPWPLILLEGGEKTGKGWQVVLLSASDKVGRTVVIDLNEGAWDEYGLVPGARFEIAEHDGSWASLLECVADAKEAALADRERGEKPFVLAIDGMTAEWDLLKSWADARARTSAFNRKKLEKDPNAEITIPMNIWNDANGRHRRLMTILMTFPGIVVMTARGGHVAAIGDDGKPVEGKKAYRVEGNKNLGFDSSCWLRVSRDERPVIIGARSVHIGMRPGIDPPKPLADDWSLEGVIFGALKCDPGTAHVRDLVVPRPDSLTPEEIRDEALESTTDFARVKELHADAARLGYEGLTVISDRQEEEEILAFLLRIGREKGRAEGALPAARPGPGATRPSRQAAGPGQAFDGDAEAVWVADFVARLGETAEGDDEGITARRREINEALAAKTILPRTASELHRAVADTARSWTRAAAA